MNGRAKGGRSAVIHERRYYFFVAAVRQTPQPAGKKMPAYVVVQITVDDPVAYDQYSAARSQMILADGPAFDPRTASTPG
jgi:hypothetical protein